MRKARIYDARQLPAYLSPAQYAELMSIDKKTVQKMCRSGLLPAEKAILSSSRLRMELSRA